MAIELPPDPTDFVCRWLAPVIRAAGAREVGDPLPFCVVFNLGGPASAIAGTSDSLVQLDVFARAGDGLTAQQAANLAGRLVATRMSLLEIDTGATVDLGGGRLACVDSITCDMSPHDQPAAEPEVARQVGRWQIGTSYLSNHIGTQ